MTNAADWCISGLSLAISLLLSLKLIEMAEHTFAVSKVPRSLVDRFDVALLSRPKLQALLGECRRVWDPMCWMFTRRLLRLPRALRRPLKIVFRWPVLMVAQALFLYFAHLRVIVAIGCFLLVAGVWLEIVQRFVFRMRFGYLDTFVRKISARSLASELQLDLEVPHILDMVGDLILLFGRLAAVVIFGYAAVYSAIQLNLGAGSFSGEIGTGPEAVLSMIYFSVVTFATVGYGDIAPRTAGVRLIVSSEILAGMLMLVFLITTFTLTSSPSASKGESSS